MGGRYVPDENEDEDMCYHHSGVAVCSVQAVMVTSSASDCQADAASDCQDTFSSNTKGPYGSHSPKSTCGVTKVHLCKLPNG